MPESDVETVLRRWIEQANSPLGELPADMSTAEWVAKQFSSWWKEQVEEHLTDAHAAAHALRSELNRLSRSGELDQAMHDLTHLQDALYDLAVKLGFNA